MEINSKGLELIKQFEGCILHSYKDCVGVLTIGYGHTQGVKEGQVITQAVIEYQRKHGLAVDGIVGANTLKAILKQYGVKND